MPQSLSFLRDSTKHSKLHSAVASSAAEFFTAFLNISAMVQLVLLTRQPVKWVRRPKLPVIRLYVQVEFAGEK